MLSVLLALALPTPAQTVIYEVNIRAFGPKPGFNAVTARLDSLRKLGVNVLWLMPIQPVGKERSAGGLGSPYAVSDFDKVNPEFGTEDDFKRLIKEAHRRKMAVLIDWVANHTAWDHPWIKQHPDWYTHDAAGKITIPAGTNWQDVADLNFDNPDLRIAMTTAMRGWVTRYDLDGFRFDTADWVPFDYWKPTVTDLRQSTSHPLLLLAEGARSDHYAAGFDLTYGWRFQDRLAAIYKGAKASSLAEASQAEAKGIPNGARRLRFITNHDKSAWDASLLEFYKTEQGAQTAFAITALYGGTPLVYTGQEVGWPKRIPIFSQSTVDWSRSPTTEKWTADLLRFRREHLAAQSGDLTDMSTDDAVIFTRKAKDDEILVIANVRDHPVTASVPGKWKSAFPNQPTAVSTYVEVPALSCYIYSRRPSRDQ